MKNITELLKDIGIEIPQEKQAEFNKAFGENYKTVAEVEKKVAKLEAERDTEKTRADNAEGALEKFKDIDPAQIQTELADWKKKAEEAEQNAAAQLAERDFSDALKTELEAYAFSSEYAKQGIIAKIKEAGLKLSDGKILGLKDLMDQIKEKDADAFVDADADRNRARFTQHQGKLPTKGTKLTPAELMKLKNEFPEIDIKQYM